MEITMEVHQKAKKGGGSRWLGKSIECDQSTLYNVVNVTMKPLCTINLCK
jgi:hypothetical protein